MSHGSSNDWQGFSLASMKEVDESRKVPVKPLKRKDKVDVSNAKTMADITKLAADLEKQDNVKCLEGNLKQKIVLEYVRPDLQPELVFTKKNKNKTKLKTRGTVTTPTPLTVESATWNPLPRTHTQSVGTRHVEHQEAGVQGERLEGRECSTMTEENKKQWRTVGIETELEEEQEKRPVFVNRSVQGTLFRDHLGLRKRVNSVGTNCRTISHSKSVGTDFLGQNQSTETDHVRVTDRGIRAVPQSTHTSTSCTDRGVTTMTPLCYSKQNSTADLRAFKSTGTSTIKPIPGPAKSTNTEFKTHRHMGVGTNKTLVKVITQLEDELENIKQQRLELEILAKRAMVNEELTESRFSEKLVQKQVANSHLMSCAFPSHLSRYCHHSMSSPISACSTSKITCQCSCTQNPADSAFDSSISSESSGISRSRFHSIVLTEPEKKDLGWYVRVVTPTKLDNFHQDVITRDSKFH